MMTFYAAVPNKGVTPLRCLRSYPSALCGGYNLLTQTAPAAKFENPMPSVRPSTENAGGLFLSYPSHQKGGHGAHPASAGCTENDSKGFHRSRPQGAEGGGRC